MIVRTSSTGELMVIVICKITEDHEMELFKQLLQFVADSFPEITSLLYIICLLYTSPRHSVYSGLWSRMVLISL